MKVRTRLVVFGALLPVALLALAIVVAGWLFRRDQLAEVERRLLAQAAVETVGMFDGPDGVPHVHMPRSPLAEEVKDFAPESALYDDAGALIIHVEDHARVPASLPLRGTLGQVRLGEQVVGGVALRTLELPLRAPDGRAYTLWLGASLAPVEATLARFYAATLSAVGALALVLFTIQLVVARRLARRIGAMTSFLPRLRDGDRTLPPDPTGDELAALRDVLRAVSTRLAEARVEQDRLLASAAHELRMPLTVLRTEVDLALRKQRSEDELRAALRSVRDDVDRLGQLAGALLDLQAVRHLGFDRTGGDLAQLVREAVDGLRTVALARRIELRVVSGGDAPARFDERALRQAVDNLLGNALKHAPPGTAIEIALTHHESRWQIAVSDRGPGVPAGDAERIFEPFQRGSPEGAGAGLGLTLVREVAQRHGGRAWLDPAYAGGARFVLELAG
ncbi:MAG: HAMP domain-containing histidine kinase [Deltaproteobacteria bacterium]|nr:HAMP domain-containing histidine kinase [Deltaproteobacteria bacterium]MCW5807779.1 HAMP domain-containing histidine kinase [Deltaproteobacteria bacterium]